MIKSAHSPENPPAIAGGTLHADLLRAEERPAFGRQGNNAKSYPSDYE